MNVQFTENKLIELFIEIDDLLIAFRKYQAERGLIAPKKQGRRPNLVVSEICTILAAYHLSGYKCFEYYYKNKIQVDCKSYFPEAPSYECFLSYIPRSIDAVYLWLFYTCSKSQQTNLYFVDSKKIAVCHLKRERQHRVFKGIARKGKSSMGWFYGLKMHLVINNLGEIMSFQLSSGNVADNNQALLKKLFSHLQGTCVGDKGYLSKLFGFFYENGLHLLTKPKKNMKNKIVIPQHNELLNKRGLIESVFDILTSICDIEHTRHRKPDNAFVHILAGLVAYQHLDKKPAIFFPSITNQQPIAA